MRQIVADRASRNTNTGVNTGSGHHDFRLVHRYGPELTERVAGSAQLRNWQRVGRGVSAALAEVSIDGLDRMPATGPVILTVNHRSLMDGAQLPVRRDRLDPGPIQLALTPLERGGALGIFPEVTRGDGSVATARPDVGYFAHRTAPRRYRTAGRPRHRRKRSHD